jgi:hypothetical protein
VSPQPQYLRGPARLTVRRILHDLPRWHEVRIRGSEPAEIRSVEQLLSWLDQYRTRVVEKLVEERDEAREKAKAYKANRDQLDRGIAALGLDRDAVLAADPWAKPDPEGDAYAVDLARRISGRDRAAGPDS